MRVLLDECVNRRLKASFSFPDVLHAADVGLDTLKNGALLRTANETFDAIITIDKNMPYQSSLKGLKIAVIVLDARNNSLPELRPFIPEIETRLSDLSRGEFTVIRRPR